MTKLYGELPVRHRSDTVFRSAFGHAYACGTRPREGHMAQPGKEPSKPHDLTSKSVRTIKLKADLMTRRVHPQSRYSFSKNRNLASSNIFIDLRRARSII